MQQQSKRFTLPSGAQLAVTVAPFADAMALLKEALKTLRGMSLNREDLEKEVSDIMKSPKSVSLILERVISFATSDGVQAALFRCFERALYIPVNSPTDNPGLRVNQNLFDNPDYGSDAREDYAQMVVHVLEVNCAPFLAKALSGFLAKPKAQMNQDAQPTKLN